MWLSLIAFLFVIVGVTLWDSRRIKREQTKKDLWVYLGLMAVVAAFGAVSIMGFRLPSPLDPLTKLITPIGIKIIGD
jgi:hypothetical protein